MQRTTFVWILVLVGAMVVGAVGVQGLRAEEKEYKPTAKTTVLVKTTLAGMEENEVNMLRRQFAPGWVGGKHYYSGHVFLYVLEGSIIIELEGKPPMTVGPGGVVHELPNRVMQAKNASATDDLKVILFQVGPEGKPMLIKAK